MSARNIVLLVVSIVVLVCGGCVGAGFWLWSSAVVDTAGKIDFVHPVAVPPLAPSQLDAMGRRVFDLTAQAGTHDFTGTPARTWGYNGSYLGPTLRATRGETVVVNVHNGLTAETTVHWHGMHLPAIMDGGPHQLIPPDGDWSPSWKIDQPAATTWYHPHPHGETAGQVYRGLAGLFIVDDPQTDNAALPHRYGVDDVPVIVADFNVDSDGELEESGGGLGGMGILGDTIAVNGTTGPYLDVTATQTRLRLLNASNARIYDFGFADDRSFALVATDGGLLSAPYGTNRIMLSPGERAEIVVTMRPGERAVLRSTPPPAGQDALTRNFIGAADTMDIMELRAASTLTPNAALPSTLTSVPRLNAGQAVQNRSFTFSDRQINGLGMDMNRIDAAIVRNSLEAWTIQNSDGLPHNLHIHGVSFQVHTVDGAPPPPELAGWKDTITLRPGRAYQILVPFGPYSDPNTPYMIHCHILLHEDEGMMAQFVVVEPGQSAGTPPHQHGG